MAVLLELVVRALENLEGRWRSPPTRGSAGAVHVHTAEGDVTLKLRLPA